MAKGKKYKTQGFADTIYMCSLCDWSVGKRGTNLYKDDKLLNKIVKLHNKKNHPENCLEISEVSQSGQIEYGFTKSRQELEKLHK